VVILHIATEPRGVDESRALTLQIVERFRAALAAVGTAPPRFLLVGPYMHAMRFVDNGEARVFIEGLNQAYLDIASSEPDCAFYSLYHATDGTFFTTDEVGGPGTRQQARDWLDTNGWSGVTYGGDTYHLSSDTDGGLDGVLLDDMGHVIAPPAAAFFARLLGDAIGAAACPGDFDGDGVVDSRDVLAFLNAWSAREPGGDFNADGAIDTRDMLAFLNAWGVPC
jgi:hypothetical protein